jgi:hypothetical protein
MRPKKPRFCMVVVVIGVGVWAAFGAEEGDFSSVTSGVGSCARALDATRTEKMIAGRIIDRLQHESERYQSSMKSIFASLIVAFLTVSATGKMPHHSERDIAAFSPYDGGNENFAALLQQKK